MCSWTVEIHTSTHLHNYNGDKTWWIIIHELISTNNESYQLNYIAYKYKFFKCAIIDCSRKAWDQRIQESQLLSIPCNQSLILVHSFKMMGIHLLHSMRRVDFHSTNPEYSLHTTFFKAVVLSLNKLRCIFNFHNLSLSLICCKQDSLQKENIKLELLSQFVQKFL